ncbi:MAG: ATP-binding protein [Longimicrobiales bacterium]
MTATTAADAQRDAQDASSRSRGRWALGFVAAAVVALALVPIYLGQRVVEVQREIGDVLEPARVIGSRLSLVQARQMVRFQSFLLTGDLSYVADYENALGTEADLYEELSRVVQGMDLEVRERLARLSTQVGLWHLNHQLAFDSDEARRAVVRDGLDRERSRYSEVQSAALALEQALQHEVEAGRRRVARTHELQTSITLWLVVLALGATVVVGQVGRRLGMVTREADQRRRQAVEARREIDALLEATGEGVLGIDLEGRCISLNRAGSALLGVPERSLQGADVHDAIHHTRPDGTPRPRDESRILAVLRDGGRASSSDDVLWRWDGTSFPARWSVQPMVDGLEVRGAVLTFADTTEIVRKEDQLLRAVRIRDEVVSIVSHDLKNPLGVVAGAAELLLELPLEEEDRRRQAEIIRRSAERMRELVEDLLDVSRMEAGALVLRPGTEAVGPLLDDVADYFRPQAEDRGLDLDVVVLPGTTQARFDQDRIQQALSNLVANALKFTPSGGRILLEAQPVGGMTGVALSVIDTGPGIPPEEQSHLFDRFWQASRDDRTGSGLGLAIVRGIAEAHGGRVGVESRVGEGSRFTIYLPSSGPEVEGTRA